MNSLFKSLLATTIILGGAFTAFAQTEIRVDSPLPMKESFEKILPGFESKTGNKVNVRYGTGVGTKQEAAKGDPYDVYIILPPFQEAMNSGNVMRDSATTLGSFVLALTVKKGMPKPDISSAAAVKKALLSAKSIATVDPKQGSVGVATGEALKKLGITDQIKDKIKYVPNGGVVGKSVTEGESEIGMGPYVSDLKGNRNPDLVVVGALPKDASTPTDIVAVISTKANDAAAAKE